MLQEVERLRSFGLRGFGFEGESGLGEEAVNEFGPVLDEMSGGPVVRH
jgi:hypothetical protein